MADGTYIELLSFTHPESHHLRSSLSHEVRQRHPLANKVCDSAAYAFLNIPPPPLSMLNTCAMQVVARGTVPNLRLVTNNMNCR